MAKLDQDRKTRRRRGLAAPRVAAPAAAIGLEDRRQDLSGRRAHRDRLRGSFWKEARRFDMLFEPAERKSLARFSATRTLRARHRARQRARAGFTCLSIATAGGRRELAGRARIRNGVRDRRRPRPVRRLLPACHRLPDARHAGAGHGRITALPRSSSSFLRSSTPLAWLSRSTRRFLPTERAFPTSRLPARISRSDGNNPTLLYGYGGFEVSMLPSYRPARRGRLAGEGRGLCGRQHPRRRRVRAQVASSGAQGKPHTGRTTTSSPSAKTWFAAR